MTYTNRLADLHKLALRPSFLPVTPDAGPAVVRWYNELERKPSKIELLDMLAWAVTEIRNLDGEASCKSCGWAGTHKQAREHFIIDHATQQYTCPTSR